MKCILLFTACFAGLVLTICGQDEADYQKWMKTVGATSGSLRKNLDAKNGDAASADAKKLQVVFEQVHMFWHKKNLNDAMTYAMEASTAFGNLASQAAAGQFDDVAATLKTASATCGGCHAAHREKAADGSLEDKVATKAATTVRSCIAPGREQHAASSLWRRRGRS